MLRGRFTMFIDQYGSRWYSCTLKDLQSQVRGRVGKMYVDKKDGSTMHIGYVIGQRWLTAWRPVEIKA